LLCSQGPKGRQGAEQQNASIFSIKVLQYLNITVKTLAFGACVHPSAAESAVENRGQSLLFL